MDSGLLRSLHTGGPAPAHAEQLMLFGQFVGSWCFAGVEYDLESGGSSPMHGEWHFGWVLQGRAVQDVLIVPGPDGGPGEEYGSTLRYYDPEADLWRVTWVGPGSNAVKSLVATRLGRRSCWPGRPARGIPCAGSSPTSVPRRSAGAARSASRGPGHVARR